MRVSRIVLYKYFCQVFNSLLEDKKLEGTPLLVYANKQDLMNAVSASETVQYLSLHSIRDKAWQIQPYSAISEEGLQVIGRFCDVFCDVLLYTSISIANYCQMLDALLEDKKLAGVPLLVYANKQDLINAKSASEISETLMLNTLRDRAWQIQACSAVINEGLEVFIFFLSINSKDLA